MGGYGGRRSRLANWAPDINAQSRQALREHWGIAAPGKIAASSYTSNGETASRMRASEAGKRTTNKRYPPTASEIHGRAYGNQLNRGEVNNPVPRS